MTTPEFIPPAKPIIGEEERKGDDFGEAGDTVKAGQVLVRLDARAAEQNAASAAAQVEAARAAQVEATREFERQKQLFEKNFISRAALDRAEGQYKATQAQAAAQLAAAGAARTQSGGDCPAQAARQHSATKRSCRRRSGAVACA